MRLRKSRRQADSLKLKIGEAKTLDRTLIIDTEVSIKYSCQYFRLGYAEEILTAEQEHESRCLAGGLLGAKSGVESDASHSVVVVRPAELLPFPLDRGEMTIVVAMLV